MFWTVCICSISLLCFPLVIINPTQLFAQEEAVNPREAEAFFVAQKAFIDGFYEVSRGLLQAFLKNYPASSSAADARLLIGQSYFRQNLFVNALSEFESLAKHPQAAPLLDEINYWIAEVHFKGNNFNKAAEYYLRVVQEYPSSKYRGAAYYSLAWCRMAQERFNEALEYFRVVESTYSNEPYFRDTPLKIMECLYHLRNHEALKAHFRKYESEYSQDAVRSSYLNFYLAESYYYSKNFEEAIDAYRRVISGAGLLRLESLSWLGIAWSHLKLKKYEQAQEAFAKVNPAELEKPNKDILKLGEAILSAETGNADKALSDYEFLAHSAGQPSVVIQAQLGRADILYEQSKYEEAIIAYRLALDEARKRGLTGELVDNAHYGLAWVFLKQGQYQEAIQEFRKIVSETGDKVVKISALCQIGDAYQESQEYEKARQVYDQILREYPTGFYSDYVQYQLGMLALKDANYDGAIMSFMSLKRNFPESKLLDDASYALGLAYFQRQEYETSREIFERFQEEFKDSSLRAQSLYLLGTSLYNLGLFEQAIEAFKNVIRFYGNSIDLIQKAEYEIADCFYQMGREKEGLARFEQLRSKYPDSSLTAEIMWWLGEYYYRLGDLEVARRYFRTLIDDFPESALVADAYYALGWGFEEESRHQEAIESFRKVIEVDQTGLAPQAAIAIADIYAKKDKHASALQVYAEIMRRYPNLVGVVYPKMAEVYAQSSQFAEALKFYRKGMEVVPVKEMAGIQFKIAQVFEKQGMTDEAVEEYLKVTYLYSQDSELAVKSLLRVAQIYEQRREFREAVLLYQRVMDLQVEEAKFAREKIESLESMIQ